MKCLLVLNRHSRSGDGAQAELVRRFAERDVELVGGGPHEPQALAERLAGPQGRAAERIVVGGGDGTLNACLRDLIGAGRPVALLPLGTANDLARNLGIPAELDAALEIALSGQVRAIDVGLIEERPFLNVATIGLGPEVTKRLSSELKARLGFLSYPRALISAYRDSSPFRVTIRAADGQALQLRCLHLAVGNGRYYGGGAVVSHVARLDDGLLHVSALRPRPLWRLLLQAPLLGLGRHDSAPDAVALASREVRIETRRPKPISADGEMVAQTPARFALLPGALSVVVPASAAGAGIRPA